MESKIQVAGHAVHPILIVFPLGLLATSVIFDIAYLINRNATFALVAYWMMWRALSGGWPHPSSASGTGPQFPPEHAPSG